MYSRCAFQLEGEWRRDFGGTRRRHQETARNIFSFCSLPFSASDCVTPTALIFRAVKVDASPARARLGVIALAPSDLFSPLLLEKRTENEGTIGALFLERNALCVPF